MPWRRTLLLLLLLLLLPSGDGGRSKGKRKKGGNKRGAAAGEREAALVDDGTGHLNAGRLDAALASFDAALAASPSGGGSNARVNRGLTLQRLGRYEEALEAYDSALELNPRCLYSLYNKGLALRELGRPAEAVGPLRTAVAARPTFADAHHDLCAALFGVRDPAADVTSRQTAEHRAYLEAAIGSCDAAIANEEHSQYPGEGMSMAHETKGLILDVLQRRAEAADATATALNLSPSHRPLATVTKEIARSTQAPAAHGALQELWPGAAATSLLSRRFDHTPFFLVESTAAAVEQMNAGLREVVNAMMAADPRGSSVSNVGGWQQSKAFNFFEEGSAQRGASGAAVRSLYLHVLQQVSCFLSALGLPDGTGDGGGVAPFVTVREAWANVNGKGDSNYEHAHGTSVFSGCYYLASGFEEGDSRAATGLRLHKPGGAEEDGGEHWSSQALGRAGTLALWPGAVVHSVPEHTGTGQRMSVAFNVGLTLKTDDLAVAAAAHRRLAPPQEDRYFPAFHARPHAGHVNDPNVMVMLSRFVDCPSR